MASTGIFIDQNELDRWPESLRAQVLEQLLRPQKDLPPAGSMDVAPSSGSADEDERFAELSPSQAREFLAGCSAKTRAAVATIARSDSRFFNLRDVAAALDVPAWKLGGVWSGLTRRVHTITGEPDTYLIYWHGEAMVDEDGNYIDHLGEVTEITYRAFRKALAIS